ncbi:NAD(P)-dependent dehydrogenase (short-subunit alcohol dehydrogenase family) [Paenibacillus sp. V4I7]|nr:SDR family NAD(P)-dependent oxidoreductase [Paenibacillus sp. V4I7]MDQ0897443.1 NAD(P)-dependent dehydrogenase (short-subunit alcohol dehydrogenase family) [Paenibacillus sp. V4I7]
MTTQKVWFITGSSRGLGRSLTEAVLKKGDYVIATARSPKSLADLAEQYGDKIHPLVLDVTDKKAVIKAVEQAIEVFGRLDVVVNNAGYGDMASIEDVTHDDFHAQMNTNFYGVVYLTKAVLPIMRKQGGGNIIQISSIGGRIGTAGLAAYQSAKMGGRWLLRSTSSRGRAIRHQGYRDRTRRHAYRLGRLVNDHPTSQ